MRQIHKRSETNFHGQTMPMSPDGLSSTQIEHALDDIHGGLAEATRARGPLRQSRARLPIQ